MSDKNIMSLFNKKVKKIAIIMDEIDGMNNGDKGGINTLIKNPKLRASMATKGRKRVEDHFDWISIAKQVEELYKSLKK